MRHYWLLSKKKHKRKDETLLAIIEEKHKMKEEVLVANIEGEKWIKEVLSAIIEENQNGQRYCWSLSRNNTMERGGFDNYQQ